MVHEYIKGFLYSIRSFVNVISIKKEQLKAVKCLGVMLYNDSNAKNVNFDFDFSLAGKYDFTNIRSLRKKTLYKLK